MKYACVLQLLFVHLYVKHRLVFFGFVSVFFGPVFFGSVCANKWNIRINVLALYIQTYN